MYDFRNLAGPSLARSIVKSYRGAVHDYVATDKVVDHSVVQVLDGRGNRKSDSIRSLGKDGMDRGAVDDKEPIREPSLAYAAG